MDEPNLMMVCLNAFMAVMVLLSLLAFTMRLLIMLFPEKKTASDTTVTSAINLAVQQVIPGARVTRIEEIH